MIIAGLVFAAYLICVAVIFAVWVEPALRGETMTIWWADSRFYLQYIGHPYRLADLVTLSGNVIGPVVLLNFLRFDLVLVLLINIAMFAVVCFVPLKGNRLTNPWSYVLLLVINPMLMFSLTSINKEIPGACGIILILRFVHDRKWYYLVPGLLFTALSRWHQLGVCVLFLLLQTPLNPFRRRRGLIILTLILTISIVYPFLRRYQALDPIYESGDAVHALQSQRAGGVLQTLNKMQEQYGGFALVAVPKVLINFVGNVFRFYDTLSGAETRNYGDVYNTYVILGHQMAMLMMGVILFTRGAFRLNSTNIYFAVFYSILFAVGMLVNYRLFFPIYPLLCLEAARVGRRKLKSRTVAIYAPASTSDDSVLRHEDGIIRPNWRRC